MARWGKGAAVIARMVQHRRLQQVVTDPASVSALLVSARRHVESARLTIDVDPEAAYVLAYDAARKSASALLTQQGLRPTTAGGHIAVVNAMRAQFPGVAGLKSLDRLRRRRNQAEYPDPAGYDPITAEEASEAIEIAAACIASAERLLRRSELGVF